LKAQLSMRNLFTEYSHSIVGRDEWLNLQGSALGPRRILEQRLQGLSVEEMRARSVEINRLLLDSQSQNVRTGAAGKGWLLDPVPMLINNDDWEFIREGLIQRQSLLGTLYQDLYSRQESMLSGMVPMNLMSRLPSYLRELVGHIKPNGISIGAYDIVRTSDGKLQVLNQCLQMPNGLGQLLENRIIHRRVMSGEFSESGAQPVAHFFATLRTGLAELTKSARDPRIILLSPGPDHPYFAEQAYLASFLGISLVRPADLTVRNSKVYLKTLKGLRTVDVIIRWVADRHTDSLELSEYSSEGIPGLLHAVRKGSVHLVNPPGIGVAETLGLTAQLHDLCRYFKGQDLILPTIPVQWPASTAQDSVIYDLENHRTILEGSPIQYLSQKIPELSTIPFWDGNGFVARPFVWRFFVLQNRDQFEVLPSALCRSLGQERWVKDTWIVKGDAVNAVSMKMFDHAAANLQDLALPEGSVPSRTAENLFLLGRALERAEALIRLSRQLADRLGDLDVSPDAALEKTVLHIVEGVCTGRLVYPYRAHKLVEANDRHEWFKILIFDESATGSLTETVQILGRFALEVKDLLSADSWLHVEDMLYRMNHMKQNELRLSVLLRNLERLMGSLMAFQGATQDTLPACNGWFLVEMGRRMERSIHLVAHLQHMLHYTYDPALLYEVILQIQVSLVTHQRRFPLKKSRSSLMSVLLLDAEYPRSLAYQLLRLDALNRDLPDPKLSGQLAAHEKHLLQALATCRSLEPQVSDHQIEHMEQSLEQIRHSMEDFATTLMLRYFSHTRQTRNFSDSRSVFNGGELS
jgi:uncharacterized circularly permuted ATP-grasp superfamily protein/uncharacterized alpha-E superfamily protein